MLFHDSAFVQPPGSARQGLSPVLLQRRLRAEVPPLPRVGRLQQPVRDAALRRGTCLPCRAVHAGVEPACGSRDQSGRIRLRTPGHPARQRLLRLRGGGNRAHLRGGPRSVAALSPRQERQRTLRSPRASGGGIRPVPRVGEGACVREGGRRGGGVRYSAFQHADAREVGGGCTAHRRRNLRAAEGSLHRR